MPTVAEVSRSRMLESVYDRFESAWHHSAEPSGSEPNIDEFLDNDWDEKRQRDVLLELCLIDLEYRWRSAIGIEESLEETNTFVGPKLEDYVKTWPALGLLEQLPVSAIVHEFRVRCEANDTPELAEYLRRFPHQAVALRDALQREIAERTELATRGLESASTSTPNKSSLPATSARKLAPGELLGRYRILWPVGHGAMGIVYLAYDPDLDRQIALKIPFLEGAYSERLAQRFRREAKLTASLRHPNICRVLDVDQRDGIDFLTMDYIDGTSLETVLKSGPLLSPAKAARIVSKIASALQEAHAAGVVHRDIKPSNILMDRRGEPVLTDFGLARRPEVDAAEQTRPGEWFGTPAYMAPEQFSGNPDDVSPACDIFSLGVVLYRLLTGQRPFSDSTRQEDIAGRTPPAPPHTLRAGLSVALSELCLRALEFAPGRRFGSAGEFAAVLEPLTKELTTGETEPAVSEPVKAPSATTVRNNRRAGSLVTLTGVVCLASLVLGVKTWRDRHPFLETSNTNSVTGMKRLANGTEANGTRDPAVKILPRVEVHVQRAKQDSGFHVLGPELGALHNQDKIQFRVMLDEPAFVALWYVDADGIVQRRWPLPTDDATPTQDVWDPPLASGGELQEMHLLGGRPGMELVVAVTSPTPFDEQALAVIDRVRLTPISDTIGFSFVARQETGTDSATSVRLTTFPLGADPRQLGAKALDVTRDLVGRTATRKSEEIDWSEFAQRLARLGTMCHGSTFRHAP